MADENPAQPENERKKNTTEQPEAPVNNEAKSAGDGETPEPSTEEQDLIAELEKAREVIAQQEDQVVRARAEMENARRRNEREMHNARKFAIERVITELLPVLDSLEMALQTEEQTVEKLTEGVSMTLDMFSSVLAKQGVEVLDPTGELFDPNLHEAMTIFQSEEFPPNTVTQVFQKGYLLNERVVRPAKVIVAKAPE